MTKPRLSTTREIFGIMGTISNASNVQATWNKYFDEQGIDAFMDKYPTTQETIPERLSEMFSFDRRLYIVGDALQEHVLPLLDTCDSFVKGKVNIVVNTDGVFCGYFDETPLDSVSYYLQTYCKNVINSRLL